MMNLAELISGMTGTTPSEEWLAAHAASAMVRVRILAPCRAEEWLTVNDLPPDVLVLVADALARVQRNPEGYRTEQVGEYSYTRAGDSVGQTLFTDDEAAAIVAYANCGGGSSGGFVSVRTQSTLPVVLTASDRAIRRQRIFRGPR
jgi:hypothetical protein